MSSWSIDFRGAKAIFLDKHLMPEDYSCELILSTQDDDRLKIKLTFEQLKLLTEELTMKKEAINAPRN
jgi:hypothetical protein